MPPADRPRGVVPTLALALGLVSAMGCVIPVATVTGDRWIEPPTQRSQAALSPEGTRVRVVTEIPQGCALVGYATGVGYTATAADPHHVDWRLPDNGDPSWLPHDVALTDLRNAAGEGGATVVIVDAECSFAETGWYLALYGRAYRCPVIPPAIPPVIPPGPATH